MAFKSLGKYDPNIFFSLTCACAKIVIWNQWGYRLVYKYIPHLPIPYGGYIILQRGDSLTTLCELSRHAPLIGSTFLTSDILVLPRFCPNLDAQEVFLEQHKVWKKIMYYCSFHEAVLCPTRPVLKVIISSFKNLLRLFTKMREIGVNETCSIFIKTHCDAPRAMAEELSCTCFI